MAEQDVAHRAAAQSGDGADEAQAEAVHAAAHAHHGAGHGFGDDRKQVEGMEQHGGEPWWGGAREIKDSAHRSLPRGACSKAAIIGSGGS